VDLAGWLKLHPYLAQIAAFESQVREAAADAASGGLALPARVEPWSIANAAGVAALRDPGFRAQVVDAAGAAFGSLLERLAASPLPARLGESVTAIRDRLKGTPGEDRAVVSRMLEGVAEPGGEAGLTRHLAWSAVAAVLGPAIQAFEAVPEADEPRWTHSTCPTCGALPVVAELVPRGEGRARRFACGLCRTRWGYKRIGCPYCQNDDPARIDLFEIEGETMLRLDTCGECKGYVKTVKDEAAPPFLADDWSTVHVDVLASAKGYRRLGASLYEIPQAGN
jgi:FdhE protein